MKPKDRRASYFVVPSATGSLIRHRLAIRYDLASLPDPSGRASSPIRAFRTPDPSGG